MMDKRYQVFVSSTYQDLEEERREVMQVLLEMKCMPAGMELFPAASEDQWSLIKRVIDESDYYVVISAGRYGSMKDGISYTEMEYQYALSRGMPVLAFPHKDLGQIRSEMSEKTEQGQQKLAKFRELMKSRLCRFWTTPADLAGAVSRSLNHEIGLRPGVGWIRADKAAEAVAAPEILRLRQQVEELGQQLEAARFTAPEGADKLAQGDERFLVHLTFSAQGEAFGYDTWDYEIPLTWNQIFFDLGPAMLNESSELRLRKAANAMVETRSAVDRGKDARLKDYESATDFRITDEDYHTIKVQLLALGLIAKSDRPRTPSDTNSYWTLTPLGERSLTSLRAIPKGEMAPKHTAVVYEDEETEGTEGPDKAEPAT